MFISKKEKKNMREERQIIWECTICGYEYIGDEISVDYICPICQHAASDFIRIKGDFAIMKINL